MSNTSRSDSVARTSAPHPSSTLSSLALAAQSTDVNGEIRVIIAVDPADAVGRVKPVNGVGQPPMVGQLNDWPMFRYLKEAGIPYSRLHDVGGWLGGGLYVDIPNLFPDFDADEDDSASYRFAYTDSLMKALDENGVEPFFRLGVTIENFARGDDGSLAVMVANDGDEALPVVLSIDGKAMHPADVICRITDADRTDAEVPLPAELPPHSFALVEW